MPSSPEADRSAQAGAPSDAAAGRAPPPPPPPDDENPALIDAFKTFRYTVLGAIGFVGASFVIIALTRWG